jgi:phosphohistidine phosphatase
MKTLTQLRHAKSSWDDASLPDADRPLNGRGRRDAPTMGKRMLKAGIRPALIVSSPAVRAWTTARTVAIELGYPLEFLEKDAALYLASLDRLIDVVIAQDNAINNLMLVGHNPGLTAFANYLVPGLTSNLPTCAVISVSMDIESWDLYSPPAAKLDYFDYPKRLKDKH